MGNVAVSLDRKDDEKRANDTIEVNTLNKLLKDSWRANLEDQSRLNKHPLSVFEDHALNMRDLLNAYDYEIFSIPNIISHSKQMSKGEIKAYISSLEAIAFGYRYKFDSELTNLLLTGLTLKAKDFKTIARYYTSLLDDLERNLARYQKELGKENKKFDTLVVELKSNESSLLRFLKKKRIVLLRRVIARRTIKIKRIQKRAVRYEWLIKTMSSKVNGYYQYRQK